MIQSIKDVYFLLVGYYIFMTHKTYTYTVSIFATSSKTTINVINFPFILPHKYNVNYIEIKFDAASAYKSTLK